MQLPKAFTREQFVEGDRTAYFLGVPLQKLLNLARREPVMAYPIKGDMPAKGTQYVDIT